MKVLETKTKPSENIIKEMEEKNTNSVSSAENNDYLDELMEEMFGKVYGTISKVPNPNK